MAVKSESEFEILLGGDIGQFNFTKFSGGKRKRDLEKYPLGDKNKFDSILGMVQYDDITLECPYDPTVHDALDAALAKYCGETIQVQVTPQKSCPEYQPDGQSRIYTGLKPSEQEPPEVDRGGNGVAMFKVSFTVSDMEYA